MHPTRAAYVNFVDDTGPELVMKLDATVPSWNQGIQVNNVCGSCKVFWKAYVSCALRKTLL